MRRALPIGLALAFLLTGCGGGSGTPLTKAEYASKADAICGKYNQQITSFANPKNLSDLAKVADNTLSVLDQAISDLSKLVPPASEKAVSDQWLTQVRNLKDDLQEIRDKAKANDMEGVQGVVPKATDHNSKSNALANQLGMSVCNKD
jgi:LPS O-antigen subunit length determinant protein (WzzB/FepE family)